MSKLILILFLTTSGFALGARSVQSETPKKSGQEHTRQEKPAAEPSLAELARRVRQQKAAPHKPVPVFTNEDLRRMGGANVSTGSAPVPEKKESEPGEEIPVTEAQPDSSIPSEEKIEEWKAMLSEAVLNLRNAINQGLVLQLRMNNMRNAYLREDDGGTQQRLQGELDSTLQQIQTNKTAQADARRTLERLQREARLGGLTPRQIKDLTGPIPETPDDILTPETPGS